METSASERKILFNFSSRRFDLDFLKRDKFDHIFKKRIIEEITNGYVQPSLKFQILCLQNPMQLSCNEEHEDDDVLLATNV